MFRWLRRLLSLVTLFAFVSSGAVLVPPAFDAWRIVRHWNDPDVAVDLHLEGLVPGDYERETEKALAENDPELAQSILALADQRHVALPPELRSKVADAVAAEPGVVGQVWDGAVYGEGDTAVGLAATVATDLMVVGDIRDLVRQGIAYPDYDPVVVALAAVGVGLTAATYGSAGAAAPIKLGASLLKLAKRTGKLGARLGDELFRLTRRAIDAEALEATLRAGRRFDWAAARHAAGNIVRRDVARELTSTGAVVGGIAAAQGPRAALDTLKVAESTAEVSRLGRIAEKAGVTYRGALRLAPRLAKAIARTSKTFFHIIEWVLAGLFWMVWLAWRSVRVVHKGAKLGVGSVRAIARRRTRRLAAVTGYQELVGADIPLSTRP